MRRQIDGLLFDKMLRSNTLQDLGIEELNARLALSIRRSWTTDFASVSFIDYGSDQGRVQQQPGPAPEQRPADLVAPSCRVATNGLGAASSRAAPGFQRPWATEPPTGFGGAGERWAERRGAGPPQDPYGSGADPRAELFGRGRASGTRGDDGPAATAWAGGHPAAANGLHPDMRPAALHHSDYDSGGYPDRGYGGKPDFRGDVPEGSMDGRRGGGYALRPDHRGGDLATEGTLTADFVRGPGRGPERRGEGLEPPPGGGRRGFGYRPDFRQDDLDGAADGQRPRGYAHAMDFRGDHPDGHLDVPRGRGYGHRMDFGDDPDGRGSDQQGQRTRPSGSPSGSPMPVRTGQLSPQHSEHWASDPRAGDPRTANNRQFRPPPPHGGWEDGGGGSGRGFEETFVPRGPAPVTYPSEASYQAARRPAPRGGLQAPQEQWGGGLDELMPPRQRPPTNVAAAYAEQAREREGPAPGRVARGERLGGRAEALADWGGMSFDDAMAPKRHGTEANDWQAPASPLGGAGGDEDGSMGDSMSGEVLVPRRPPPGREAPHSGGSPARRSPLPPRGRASARPAEDDGWGGQSLGDALAPKKAPVLDAGGGSSGSQGRPPRGPASPAAATAAPSSGSDCSKTPDEIIAWVRSLPESHVPEKARNHLAAIIEDEGLGGAQFSRYVQQVPPEICAPKHAMKLKAAWANVLKETAAREVALSNLANQPKQKATMIVV